MIAKEAKHQQVISFDRSTLDASVAYLENRTKENLVALLTKPGSELAYKHHKWSSVSSKLTIEEFWKKELERIGWNEQGRTSVEEIIQSLETQRENWLDAVLMYLPRGHVFNTTVYFILGYDNIVYDENVTLNLNFESFHKDRREAVYYLIHELAHAGYFRYRKMPDLANPKTFGELVDVVKLLTHLEGMGVVSPFKLRIKEGGLMDNDYQVLLHENEKNARVHDYFSMLSKLEEEPDRNLHEDDYHVLSNFSERPKRLWYITGAHMALKIEERSGTATLRNLVKEGHDAFFKMYLQLENPFSIR